MECLYATLNSSGILFPQRVIKTAGGEKYFILSP